MGFAEVHSTPLMESGETMAIDYLHAPLGDLARVIPGATKVFHDYRLDFCCNGHQTLAEATRRKKIDPQRVIDSLHVLTRETREETDWSTASAAELINHILTRYHARHPGAATGTDPAGAARGAGFT